MGWSNFRACLTSLADSDWSEIVFSYYVISVIKLLVKAYDRSTSPPFPGGPSIHFLVWKKSRPFPSWIVSCAKSKVRNHGGALIVLTEHLLGAALPFDLALPSLVAPCTSCRWEKRREERSRDFHLSAGTWMMRSVRITPVSVCL